MGRMNPPKFFCAFSETLTDVANTLLHASLLVMGYVAITKIPETDLGPPHTQYSLTHIAYYIDDVITSVQGGPE